MKENITVYESWEQLTVGQYEELLRIVAEHPDDSAKPIVEYLYDVADADRLPLPEYVCYVAGLRRFIDRPVEKSRLTPSASYRLNGREYRVDITPTAFTVAQYTDLTNYIERKGTLTDLLTVVLIPDGREYGDGYDMRRVRDDIAALPLEAGLAVIGFFGRWSRASIKTFLRSLTSMTKKGKVSEELKEKLEKEVRTFFDLLASPPTC